MKKILLPLIAIAALSAPAAAATAVEREAVQLSAPDYPRGAERRGIEGEVTVRYAIEADGSVSNVEIVNATPSGVFDRAAVSAVEGWQFAPAAERTEGHTRNLTFALN